MTASRYDRRGPDPRFADLDRFADRVLAEEARINSELADKCARELVTDRRFSDPRK